MSRDIFPFIQPTAVAAPQEGLPMLREVKIDFATGRPIIRDRGPEMVEGADAVLVWAWMALRTPRFRHAIFPRAYGAELDGLIGQPYTEALKQAEARRYVTECLTASPYITSVDDITVDFADGRLAISCALSTVYGKKELTANV